MTQVGPPVPASNEDPDGPLTLSDEELVAVLRREADWHVSCYGRGCALAKVLRLAADRLQRR